MYGSTYLGLFCTLSLLVALHLDWQNIDLENTLNWDLCAIKMLPATLQWTTMVATKKDTFWSVSN